MYSRFTMRFASALAACAALSLVIIAPAAHAQTTFFANNATLNSANPVAGSAAVGYANQTDFSNKTNPTSPTVSLVSGGSVAGSLLAYNSSTVNFSGGSVGGSLFAQDNSTINVSGGSVGRTLEADGNGTINLFGTGQTATSQTSNANGFSLYSLSGLLSDGTLLVNKFLYVQNGTGARFTLNNTAAPAAVPEPGNVALLVGLTTAGASLLRKRRAHK